MGIFYLSTSSSSSSNEDNQTQIINNDQSHIHIELNHYLSTLLHDFDSLKTKDKNTYPERKKLLSRKHILGYLPVQTKKNLLSEKSGFRVFPRIVSLVSGLG